MTLKYYFVTGLLTVNAVMPALVSAKEPPFKADLLFHSLRQYPAKIYLANSQTGAEKPLLGKKLAQFEQSDAHWSPDGKQIAFVVNHAGNREIYLSDAMGKQPRRITDKPGLDARPRWSPDGGRLAWLSAQPSDKSGILILDLKTNGIQPVAAPDGNVTEFTWSPDGKSIAYSAIAKGRADIWVAKADGSEAFNITPTSGGKDNMPAWSPDSSKLAIVVHPQDKPPYIQVVDIATRQATRITDEDNKSLQPKWSPDGNHLIYLAVQRGADRTDVFKIPVQGGQPENLTANPDADLYPALSPDGKKLLFTNFKSGAGQIYLMDLDSKDVRRITQTQTLEFAPAWKPSPPPGQQAGKTQSRSHDDARS